MTFDARDQRLVVIVPASLHDRIVFGRECVVLRVTCRRSRGHYTRIETVLVVNVLVQ